MIRDMFGILYKRKKNNNTIVERLQIINEYNVMSLTSFNVEIKRIFKLDYV